MSNTTRRATGLRPDQLPTSTFPNWVQDLLTVLSGLLVGYLFVRRGLCISLPVQADAAVQVLDWLAILMLALDLLPLYRHRGTRGRIWSRSWFDTLLLLAAIPASAHQAWGAVFVLLRQMVHYGRRRAFGNFADALSRRPIALLAASFAALVGTGTVLLLLPAATVDGRGVPFINAFFTSASATCVTGLTVLNIGQDLTRFGQTVVLVLIQLGGLGIMTFYAGLASALGVKLSLAQRRNVAASVEEPRGIELARTLRYVLLLTIAAELGGAALLYTRMLPRFPTLGESLYAAAFHSVSAFCNAGFSLFSDNLLSLQRDWIANLVIIGLIVSGGIGFSVAHEIFNRETLRRGPHVTWRHLTTHTRLVLAASGLLIAVGATLFLLFESGRTLAGLDEGTKLLAALFQAVTPRTAGFNTVPLDRLHPVTLLLFTLLMFIGASPGGTGGGIKTTTAAVLLLSVRSQFRGREDVEYAGRAIPKEAVFRATAVVALSALALFVSFGILLLTEDKPFAHLLLEATSAFGTVGLSTGITPRLGGVGKLVLILLMYVGRIGPLTLVLALRAKEHRSSISYPTARIMVG